MTDKLKAIVLFADAGGLSYGFEAKGYDVVLALEKDSWAVETYKENHRNKNCIEADITQVPDVFLWSILKKVDVVMGVPPCQGFSIAVNNRCKEGVLNL